MNAPTRQPADAFYAAHELKYHLAMAKGARTQAEKSLQYAVTIYAWVIASHQSRGARLKARLVMDRATRRLEAAEALVAAITEELEWA